jgi:hypothetical protein
MTWPPTNAEQPPAEKQAAYPRPSALIGGFFAFRMSIVFYRVQGFKTPILPMLD